MGFFRVNRAVSGWINGLFPQRTAGILEFPSSLRAALRHGMTVVEIGGGRTPMITADLKRELQLRVVGVDVSEAELAAAPHGVYDDVVACDASDLSAIASGSADVVFSRAVLEHVRDPASTLRHSHRILRSGGVTLHHVPNKWAPFALVNAALPPAISRRLLYATNPEAKSFGGFPAYYRGTTPRSLTKVLRRAGFVDVAVTPYYRADYLDFFVPAHLLYVGWQEVMQWSGSVELCESFTVSARKSSDPDALR